MLKRSFPLKTLLLLGLLLGAGGCNLLSSNNASTNGSGDGSGGGGGGTFSTADVAKSSYWQSGCIAATDPLTGSDHYSVWLGLGLSGAGNFEFDQFWYNGTCSPVNYSITYSVLGTYAVGGVTSGNQQSIQFTWQMSQIACTGNAARTSVNSSCGGTSPYQGGTNSADGAWEDSHALNCSTGPSFPNSGAALIDNVATYDGTTLSIGMPATGIPGVFHGGTPNSAVLLNLN